VSVCIYARIITNGVNHSGLTCSKFWDQHEGCPSAQKRFRKTNLSPITPCSLYSCPIVCCEQKEVRPAR